MNNPLLPGDGADPTQPVASQQSLNFDDKLRATEDWTRESVTKRPDGSVTATRESRRRAIDYARNLVASKTVVALPPASTPLLLGPPGSTASRGLRSLVRWALSVFITVLGLLGGIATPGDLWLLLFTEPLAMIHSAGALAAAVTVHLRAPRTKVSRSVANGMRNGLLAAAVAAAMPLPDGLLGVIQAVRCLGLPMLTVWAALPVEALFRSATARRSSPPPATRRPAFITVEPPLESTGSSPDMGAIQPKVFPTVTDSSIPEPRRLRRPAR